MGHLKYKVENKNESKNTTYNLMIVEDDKSLQSFYHYIFQKSQWKIISQIENGLIAKKYYQDLFPKPSVIILDIGLPGCSGYSVANYILRQNPKQKIIFVSGNIKEGDEPKIPFDLRNIPRISKPFHYNDLFLVLNDLINTI